MKRYLITLAAVVAVFAISCNKGEKETKTKENPNPTSIGGVYLVNATVEADPEGFNMITDGGFEHFIGDENWKSRSLWYLPDYVTEAENAYDGARTLYADCNCQDWRDIAIQTICAKKGQSYTLSLVYRGAWKGLNCYMGFRSDVTHDMNTNDPSRNDAWDAGYSYTYTTTDDTELTAFFGGWCWDNLWVELDDVKVIPTGTMNDSFIPKSTEIKASSVKNASFTEVTSCDKPVFWIEDGKLYGVLHNAEIDGHVKPNVFVSGSVVSDGLKVNAVAETSFGTESWIPSAGYTIGKQLFVNGYTLDGFSSPTPENPEPQWKSAGSKVMVSSDNGANWEETSLSWPAGSKFIRNAYCAKDDYIYMFGCPEGDFAVRTYVARVAKSDFAEISKYEYWDGYEWVKGNDAVAAAITFGPADCMSVVYNPDRWTFMMIYRSFTSGQLVYRDAGIPEGEWSGEKLLMADPVGESLYAPYAYDARNDSFKFITCPIK